MALDLQDLARVKERFAAFWQGEILDRVCMIETANAPLKNAEKWSCRRRRARAG